ncbi:CRE-UGT-62 protein [Aphelenchoides avenae]|nr:CRE-UGT-62 protein [Aphelenchus avenae]
MSFMQRLKGLLAHIFVPIAHVNVVSSAEYEVFRMLGHTPERSLRQLSRTAPLVMVNSNELYDFPRPGLRRVVNIGARRQASTARPTASTNCVVVLR